MAVFIGNGSDTSPSFTFSSDTNTGIYRVGADYVGIVTGGTRKLGITPLGTVNIGPNIPNTDDSNIALRAQNTLFVGGDNVETSFNSHIRIGDGGQTKDPRLTYAITGGYRWFIQGDSSLNSGLSFEYEAAAAPGGPTMLLARGTQPSLHMAQAGEAVDTSPRAIVTAGGSVRASGVSYIQGVGYGGVGSQSGSLAVGSSSDYEIPASTTRTFTVTGISSGFFEFTMGMYGNANTGGGVLKWIAGGFTGSSSTQLVVLANQTTGSVGAITVTNTSGTISFSITNGSATQLIITSYQYVFSGNGVPTLTIT